MTASELATLIGMAATVRVPFRSGELTLSVRIIDARDSYGRTDLLVTPTDGSGEAWVSSDRVNVKT